MNDAKSTVCEHGSLRRQCRVCELESELAEAKRLSEQYLAASADNLVCFHRAENERDAALARIKELEYWRNGSWAMKALDKARDERDAALAEVERWKDDYDEEARACEENARETQEARDEAEALRAALERIVEAKSCYRSVSRQSSEMAAMAVDALKARLSPPAPAPKHEFAEGGFCNAHMTYGCECPAESLHDPKAPCPECGRRKKPAPGGREE